MAKSADSNIGALTLPELKKRLEVFGAKKSGRKKELVERLEFYMKTAESTTDVIEPEYYIQTPCSTLYSDLNSDSNFPGCAIDTVTDYLMRFEKKLEDKALDMYKEKFVVYVKVANVQNEWFVNSRCMAQMSKSTSYEIDIMMSIDGFVKECQCECGVGAGPDAHCKHVAAVLYGLSQFRESKKIITAETCTQKIQTFHKVKKYHGSPIKAENLTIPDSDPVCHTSQDPRPLHYRNNPQYQSHFRNLCLSFPGISNTPIYQIFEPANMRAYDQDHDYLLHSPSEMFLQHINTSIITPEEAEQLRKATLNQSTSAMWKQARCKRLHSSMYGRICKATDRCDLTKLAETMTTINEFTTKPIIHGRKYESVAREMFKKRTNLEVTKTGIHVDITCPYLACSPDGLVGDTDVIEIKCPYNARDRAVDTKSVPYLCISRDQSLTLKTNHDYYYQVQGQLMCTGRKRCFFVVYTFVDFFYCVIERDEKFVEDMKTKLDEFYKSYFKPAVLEKFYY